MTLFTRTIIHAMSFYNYVSIVHRNKKCPVFIEHDPNRHLDCDNPPCDVRD